MSPLIFAINTSQGYPCAPPPTSSPVGAHVYIIQWSVIKLWNLNVKAQSCFSNLDKDKTYIVLLKILN